MIEKLEPRDEADPIITTRNARCTVAMSDTEMSMGVESMV